MYEEEDFLGWVFYCDTFLKLEHLPSFQSCVSPALALLGLWGLLPVWATPPCAQPSGGLSFALGPLLSPLSGMQDKDPNPPGPRPLCHLGHTLGPKVQSAPQNELLGPTFWGVQTHAPLSQGAPGGTVGLQGPWFCRSLML